MRQAVLIAPKVGIITGTLRTTESCIHLFLDRLANDEAFPHEQVVRLPRRYDTQVLRLERAHCTPETPSLPPR